MAKPPLTPEMILSAIQTIAETGENPTQHAVRKMLGQGSYTTIGDVLRQWRADEQRSSEIAEVVVPDAVKTAAEQLLRGVYDACQADAQQQLTAERAALLEAQTKLQDAEQQAGAMADEAEAEAQAARDKLESAQERMADLESQVAASQQQLELLKSQLMDSESRVESLATDNEGLKLAAERARGEAQVLQEQLQRESQRSSAAESALGEARSTAAGQVRDLESMRGNIAEYRAERDSLNKRLDDERQARVRAETQAASFSGRIEELSPLVERAASQADLDRAELAKLRDALAAAEKKSAAMAAENELLKKQKKLPLEEKGQTRK